MACIYSYGGECTLFDKGGSGNPLGCDNNGYCVVEDDPIPSDSCEFYESATFCWHCGEDECVCD